MSIDQVTPAHGSLTTDSRLPHVGLSEEDARAHVRKGKEGNRERKGTGSLSVALS